MRKIILISVVFLLLGFAIGVQYQQFNTLNWCVDKGIQLMELKGIEVDIDSGFITLGLMQYQDRVDRFFSLKEKNASVCISEGN